MAPPGQVGGLVCLDFRQGAGGEKGETFGWPSFRSAGQNRHQRALIALFAKEAGTQDEADLTYL